MAVTKQIVDRIERARARAAVSATPMVVTLAAPAVDVDPLAVVIESDDRKTAYWEQPDLGISIAGIGHAVELPVPAEWSRFGQVADGVRDLRARTTQLRIDGAERGPLLVGAFSFFDRGEWDAFGPGSFVLPELALIRRPGGSTWVSATTVDADDDADEVAQKLVDRVTVGPFSEIAAADADHERALNVEVRDDAYVKLVREAVAELSSSDLGKVVLARELIVDHVPDLGPFLAALLTRFPSCATFAFRSGDQVFCGATPERLVHIDGVAVSTAAVAGSAPRGSDAMQDEVIADRLLHDPKESEEHGYVVSDIRRRLAESGCVVDAEAATEVMRLPGIQHLHTPITATAPVGTDVLDVVGSLHPTPAVGGLPGELALRWIAEREALDRGLYAGPVGYCDLAGNGEFRVGLRSALIDPKRSRLFVGAGIVGASEPERELEETSLKLGALLPALLGS